MSTRSRFWLWAAMVVVNLYTFSVGVKTRDFRLIGFAGFFLAFTLAGAVYFYYKLRKSGG